MPACAARLGGLVRAAAAGASGCLLVGLLALPLQADPLRVERLELSVRIDARRQALYAKANFRLRNRGVRSRSVVEFDLPAAVAPYLDVRRVWDREDDLVWRLEVEEGIPRALLVALRSPLEPEEEEVIVVSYDLDLRGASVPGEVVAVEPEAARLSTTGWYPLPASSEARVPQRFRLAVRLPRDWKVEGPAHLRRLRTGTLLASYEVELERVPRGQLLLRAGSDLP